MRDAELGRKHQAATHDHEVASTPGRTTNVSAVGAAPGGAGPYTKATIKADVAPWSARLGPGLAAVQQLYTRYASGDGGHPNLIEQVAKIVEGQPEELEAIRKFIEERDGADAGHELLAAIEAAKRKKNGISLKGGALDFGGNGLLPSVRPTVPGSTSDEKEDRNKKEAADAKRDEARRLTPKDKPYNPMLDALERARNGPPRKSREDLAIEDTITLSIEQDKARNVRADAGTPDAGSPDAGTPNVGPLLELRKSIDD